MVNPASPMGAAPRIGVKIEKPRLEALHGFFNILLLVSFLLIAGTLWLLAAEYLHLPLPEWIKQSFDNLVLIFS